MRIPFLGSLVVLSCTFAPTTADASDPVAEEEFREGRSLMAVGNAAKACPKFAAAARLSQTPGVRLNLAACYAKLGKPASALKASQEALALAERTGYAKAAAVARDQTTAIQPRLSYVTIVVPPGTVAPGLELVLDGDSIPHAAWGTALPVDPGEHELTAKAPGRAAWSTKTTVSGEGAGVSVSVPALVADGAESGTLALGPAAPSSNGTPTRPAPDGAASANGWSRGTAHALALVSGGLGISGIGVGTAFGLVANSKKSQYQQAQVAGRCVDLKCVALSQDAVSAATLSTVGFVAGGVLAAAGLVLWLTAPKPDSEGPRVALSPTGVQQGTGAGATLSGRW